MAIQFSCTFCGRALKVADEAAGTRVRCPACQNVVTAPQPAAPPPAAPSQELTLDDLKLMSVETSESAGPVLDVAPAAEPPPPAGPPTNCANCGEPLVQGMTRCPVCGRRVQGVQSSSYSYLATAAAPVEPSRPAPSAGYSAPPGGYDAPPPGPGSYASAPLPAAGTGRFLGDCAKEMLYGLKILPLCLGIILVVGIMNVVLGLPIRFLAAFASGALIIPIAIAAFVVDVAVMGYFFQFFSNITGCSIAGDADAEVPNFALGEMFSSGLRALGLVIIYVLPVVTIPLLPLGWLAVAHTRDTRGYNLGWALVQAIRRPGRLLLLWVLVLVEVLFGSLVIGLLIALAIAGLGAIGHSGMMHKGVAVLAVLVLALVFVTLTVAVQASAARMIGVLGRHNPEILNRLPERGSTAIAAVCLIGCLAFSLFLSGPLTYRSAAEVARQMEARSEEADRERERSAEAYRRYLAQEEEREREDSARWTQPPAYTPPTPSFQPSPSPSRSPRVTFASTARPSPSPRPSAGPEANRPPGVQTICMRNVRAIGQSIAEYRMSHGGANPPDLAALCEAGLPSEKLVCPGSGHAPPTFDARTGKLSGDVDYVYLGGDPGWPPGTLLLYEDTTHHGNVGFMLTMDLRDLVCSAEPLAKRLEEARRLHETLVVKATPSPSAGIPELFPTYAPRPSRTPTATPTADPPRPTGTSSPRPSATASPTASASPPASPTASPMALAGDGSDLKAFEDAAGRWGYKDSTGNVVIAPKWRNALSFSDGLAVVEYDPHVKGSLTRGPLGLANLSDDSFLPLFGYIDSKGQPLDDKLYWAANRFKDGKATVKVREYWAAYHPLTAPGKDGAAMVAKVLLPLPPGVDKLGAGSMKEPVSSGRIEFDKDQKFRSDHVKMSVRVPPSDGGAAFVVATDVYVLKTLEIDKTGKVLREADSGASPKPIASPK